MKLSEREYLLTESSLRDAFRGTRRNRPRAAQLVLADTGKVIGSEVADADDAGDAPGGATPFLRLANSRS